MKHHINSSSPSFLFATQLSCQLFPLSLSVTCGKTPGSLWRSNRENIQPSTRQEPWWELNRQPSGQHMEEWMLHVGWHAVATCGSWCISGSIWGLSRGKRTTMSPRRRRYCCPPATCTTLSWTTSLRIMTAARSRRVSVRTLSAERKGQDGWWCHKVPQPLKSCCVPQGARAKEVCRDPRMKDNPIEPKVMLCSRVFSCATVSGCCNNLKDWLWPRTEYGCVVLLRRKGSNLRLESLHGLGVREDEAEEPKGSRSIVALSVGGITTRQTHEKNLRMKILDGQRRADIWHSTVLADDFAEAAVSLLGGSHLSLSRPECWELRELPLLPRRISGQLSLDSWAARSATTHNTQSARSTLQWLCWPAADLQLNGWSEIIWNSIGCRWVLLYRDLFIRFDLIYLSIYF